MPGLEENQEVVDLVTHIFDLPKEERIKESLKMQVSTLLTVKSQEKKLATLQTQIAGLPCQANGILRFMAAMSTTKRIMVSISAILLFLVTVIGAITGIVELCR